MGLLFTIWDQIEDNIAHSIQHPVMYKLVNFLGKKIQLADPSVLSLPLCAKMRQSSK